MSIQPPPIPRRRVRIKDPPPKYRIRIPFTRRELVFQIPAISSIFFLIADSALYLLGPLLILLALGILTGLSITFFTIILPMISPGGYFTPHALLHQSFVLTILFNVLFNYYACVTTPSHHRGQNYQRVVRELADVTGFFYPETEKELDTWRMEFRKIIAGKAEAMRMWEREKLMIKHGLTDNNYNNTNIPCDKSTMGERGKDNGDNESTFDGSGGTQVRDSLTNLEEGHGSTTSASSRSPLDCEYSNNTSCGTPSSSNTTVQKRRAITTTATVRSVTPGTTATNLLTTGAAIKSPPWMLLGPHDWSFCTNSRQAKPPRAHFDHVTKSLVLNMDHYCPWMFNVVGYFNYRYFCNFLFYVGIGMMYGTMISFNPFLNMDGDLYHFQIKQSRKLFYTSMSNNTQATLTAAGLQIQPPKFQRSQTQHLYPYVPTPSECTPIAFAFMICCSVGIAVLLLLGFHLYLILTAQTTIEFHGNNLKKRRAKERDRVYVNPYDLGYRRNLEQVWGICNQRNSARITVVESIAFLRKMLAPSFREPELLPVPLVGGLRRRY